MEAIPSMYLQPSFSCRDPPGPPHPSKDSWQWHKTSARPILVFRPGKVLRLGVLHTWVRTWLCDLLGEAGQVCRSVLGAVSLVSLT